MGRISRKPLLISFTVISLLALGACDFFVSDQSRIQKAAQLRSQRDYKTAQIELKKVLQRNPDNRDARFLLGEISLFTGDVAAAEKELRRARGLGTPRDSVVIPLGQALLAQGQFERALEELDPKGIDKDEVKTGVFTLRGNAYLAMRRLDDAERAFRDALATRADSLDAQIGLAGVAQGRGDFNAAQTYIADALSKDPTYVRARLAKGQLDLDRNQYLQSEEAFVQVLKQPLPAAEEFIARNGLAESQLRQGKSAVALQNVERLLLLAPQHPRPHYFRALIAYGAGDHEAAIQHLGQILRAYPDYRPAEILLGATHYAKGNFEQADKYLSSALAADPSSEAARTLLAATRLRQQKTQDFPATLLAPEPDSPPAISTLAALEMRQGNVKQALARARGLQQGTDKDKATAGYLLEGDLHMAQGQFENAARAYDAASRRVESAAVAIRLYEARRQAKAADAAKPLEQWLSTHPDDSRVRLVLAQEYQNRGQLKQATAEYELLLKSEPDNAVVLNNLAWVYHETMDPRALGLAERAHAAQPEVGAITDTLGWLLVQEGQVQRGLTLLREAEKQAPKIPDIRYHLAVALAKTGATEEARRILADLLNSGKNFNEMAEAKQLLQQL